MFETVATLVNLSDPKGAEVELIVRVESIDTHSAVVIVTGLTEGGYVPGDRFSVGVERLRETAPQSAGTIWNHRDGLVSFVAAPHPPSRPQDGFRHYA